MVKIDFVPDDYIQQRLSNRANFMYLILFALFMGAIGITFSIIKVRQRAVKLALANVNAKITNANTQIAQLEELQAKGKAMMNTVVTAARLLEPVPKSIILACLTNNLPVGVSFLELKLKTEEAEPSAGKSSTTSQYQHAASAAAGEGNAGFREEVVNTRMEIKGIAPSDIEVANYIARLENTILLTDVALVESKERKINETKFREFKLTAMLKRDIQLTKDDIEGIRSQGKELYGGRSDAF